MRLTLHETHEISGRLVEQATDETMSNFSRYANYMRTLIPGKDTMVAAGAANTLARLVVAASGTQLANELVNYEFGRCISWIEEKNEAGMLAAMFIFRETFEKAANISFPYITTLLDLTWSTLLYSTKVDLTKPTSNLLITLEWNFATSSH